MKIIEISQQTPQNFRELRQQVLSSHPWGALLNFEALAELPENWTKATDAAYLFEPDLVNFAKLEIHEEPQEVREASAADSLIQQQGRWWPRIYMRQAMKTLMVENAPSLDNQSVAYVTGCGTWARFASVIAIQIGFRRICLVCSDEKLRDEMAETLKRQYFQVDIMGIPENELTLQPNNGSLLVNTQRHSDHSTLIEDLSYLNFLRAEGLVIDFDLESKEQTLLEEALNIGDRIVHPLELFGVRDGLFFAEVLQGIDPKVSQNLNQFQREWSKLIRGQGLLQNSPTKV